MRGERCCFSSHLLNEVERVSDHVTMINKGKIVFSAPLDDIKDTHRCLTLRFAEAQARPPQLAGVLTWEGTGHEWTAVYHGQPAELQAAAARCGAQVLDKRVPSLDEIFVARVGSPNPDHGGGLSQCYPRRSRLPGRFGGGTAGD